MSRSIAIFILIALVAPNCGLEFPPLPLVKCHADDEKCCIEQAQKFIVTYTNGIPELNIKPLDPLSIDDFVVKGALNLEIKDMLMSNMTGTEIKRVKFLTTDPSKPVKLQITFFVPQSTMKSKYKINGKILILPIRGEGDAVLQNKGITVNCNLILKFEKRDDDKSYLKDIDIKITSKTDGTNIFLSDLFNGDKALSDNILKVLNENWQLLSPDFDPYVQKSFGKEVINTMKSLLKDVPFEDWFLVD